MNLFLLTHFTYFVRLESGSIKIGHTTDLNRRLADLRGQYGARSSLLGIILSDRGMESYLHRKFAHLRVRHEQFEDCTELRQYIEKSARPYEPRMQDFIRAVHRAYRTDGIYV